MDGHLVAWSALRRPGRDGRPCRTRRRGSARIRKPALAWPAEPGSAWIPSGPDWPAGSWSPENGLLPAAADYPRLGRRGWSAPVFAAPPPGLRRAQSSRLSLPSPFLSSVSSVLRQIGDLFGREFPIRLSVSRAIISGGRGLAATSLSTGLALTQLSALCLGPRASGPPARSLGAWELSRPGVADGPPDSGRPLSGGWAWIAYNAHAETATAAKTQRQSLHRIAPGQP